MKPAWKRGFAYAAISASPGCAEVATLAALALRVLPARDGGWHKPQT
jgi:hypothetical protein